MIVLIIGGSGSGKSEYAEDYAYELSPGEKTYIATMRVCDAEARSRISAHRKQRENKNFVTCEVFGKMDFEQHFIRQITLFECMSNHVSNLLFYEKLENGLIVEEIKQMLNHVRKNGKDLIIVSNSVAFDGCQYDDGTLVFMKLFSEINRLIADCADTVIEVVCGIPVLVKENTLC